MKAQSAKREKAQQATARSAVAASPRSFWDRLAEMMYRPRDGASLAVFRIAIGVMMILEAYSLWHPNHGSISTGESQLQHYYTGPNVTFHFPFVFVSWLPMLPKAWIYATVWMIAISGLTVALGLFYRVSIVLLFLAYGYMWSAESIRTYWQSYYLIEILSLFLLMWMPAARRFSADAWLARKRGVAAPVTIPNWCLILLRGQLTVMYFYGGIAKINKDWLLDAVPVRWFLRLPGVLGPYKGWFSESAFAHIKAFVESTGLAYFLSYTGLIFDVAVGFLLMCRRTRIFALALMLFFHATNYFLIFDNIEWFPVVGALTALIFLEPDWPVRFWGWVKKPFISKPEWNWFWPGVICVPVFGALLGWKLKPTEAEATPAVIPKRAWAMRLVVLWFVFQALVPLRHYAIPGDGRFTFEGMSFSWRLKCETRNATYHELVIEDPAVVGKGSGEVNWAAWHGDHAIYRRVNPPRLDWREMPEILIVLEPTLGERIVFNPLPRGITNEGQARERLRKIWNEMYGRDPQDVQAAQLVPGALKSVADGLSKEGQAEQAAAFADLAKKVELLDADKLPPGEEMTVTKSVSANIAKLDAKSALLLRRIFPFVLQGARLPVAPFLVIEDGEHFDSGVLPRHVARGVWKNSAATADLRIARYRAGEVNVAAVYMAPLRLAAGTLLPASYLEQTGDGSLRIKWNSARDMDASQYMHTSTQPFYLRRYALRVAELWQREYGHRPAIHAFTSVSLNNRPYQQLVDPTADLASVPVTYFGHNAWIRDLQTDRIPREALNDNPL